MLILSRVKGQSIVLTASNGEQATVLIVDVKGDRVRVGIEADSKVAVHRQEVQLEIDRHKR